MADSGARLELIGVEKRYDKVVALRPTDLVIEAGEFFSLIGPSGSGKTTLLGTVAGFTPPTRGRIEVDGVDIAAMPPYRRNVGMVFQNYALFPHMTVFDNIAFPLRLRRLPSGEISAKVSDMLATVRLPDVGDRMPSQLSGGQQQRIALARAAVYNPRMLLMDEPLGALDKNLREDMQYEIKSFHRQIDATVLYVTHDQDEAAAMSDRIAIMNQGTIVQHGTPRELYEHPSNAFVAQFLGSANLFDLAGAPDGADRHVSVPVAGGGVMKALNMVNGAANTTNAVLCVRPETIRIGPDAAECGEDTNTMAGKVLDATYTAGTFRYAVGTDTGATVTVRIPSVRQSDMLGEGDTVTLAWPASSTLLIQKE